MREVILFERWYAKLKHLGCHGSYMGSNQGICLKSEGRHRLLSPACKKKTFLVPFSHPWFYFVQYNYFIHGTTMSAYLHLELLFFGILCFWILCLLVSTQILVRNSFWRTGIVQRTERVATNLLFSLLCISTYSGIFPRK